MSDFETDEWDMDCYNLKGRGMVCYVYTSGFKKCPAIEHLASRFPSYWAEDANSTYLYFQKPFLPEKVFDILGLQLTQLGISWSCKLSDSDEAKMIYTFHKKKKK